MIGIISDIHGNEPALEAVLDALDGLGVSSIICLGDVSGYYSGINACVDLVRQRAALTLMGNHDYYLTSGEGCPRSDSANRCLEYQARVIRPDNLAWLGGCKPAGTHAGIDCVHGGWNDPLDEYMKPSAAYFADVPGPFLASGHTHVPVLWSEGVKRYCNPGSVGQPRDGDPRAAFATFDGQDFTLHRVDYDIARAQDAMRAAGFSDYFYSNLERGTRIGGLVD